MSKSRFFSAPNSEATATEVWDNVNPELVIRCLAVAAAKGVGLTFGITRKRDAICIAVLHNGDVEKAYASNGDAVDVILADLTSALEAI